MTKETSKQKQLIQHIVNAWETGKPEGNYSAVSIMDDGPNGIKQISYGRSQVTEYGNLHELIVKYVHAKGKYAEELKIFLSSISVTPLVSVLGFIDILKKAGNDPIMKRVQDEFFDEKYWQPALIWADKKGFELPFSMLVIYDSFIQSGSILTFLRKRFSEYVPASGGIETLWIELYVKVRDAWLSSHKNKLLQNSSYRTKDMLREIKVGNWQLDKLPFIANGTKVI